MQSLPLKFPRVIDGLRCPACASGGTLRGEDTSLACENCGERHPVVDGIPILIDETRSVFRKADFVSRRPLYFDTTLRGRAVSAIGRFLSSVGGHTGSRNYDLLRTLLKKRGTAPRVLILGGSVEGMGMERFLLDEALDIVESDVSWGPRTQVILDAHNIPYEDETFDCVIAQAVLEHVLDPHRCVAEIHRVLKPRALVYAETPFMQQVHGGAYDFQRFTHAGHRRLFNRFEELGSGAIAGAGTVMAWSYQYLLLALLGSKKSARLMIKAFSRITGFWMKYLDRLTLWNPYSLEGASGFFFIGEKSDGMMHDLEIVEYYGKALHRPKRTGF